MKEQRFDRETWLIAALEVLAKEGNSRVHVEKLAAKLGVTKGSFYHHFDSRKSFQMALLQYWEEHFNNRPAFLLVTSTAPPKERLRQIITLEQRENLTRYDVAVRSWAVQDAEVAKIVRRADSTRYKAIETIFAEIGFFGEELRLRSSVFVITYSSLSSVDVPGLPNISDESLQKQIDFFTK